MPLIILAGIPLPVFTRNKGYLPAVSGWQLSIVPSRLPKNKANLYTCLKEVLSLANGADDQGAHIFGFHDRESDYPDISHEIHDRHRLVWMPYGSISIYGTEAFTQVIASLASFENDWRKHLLPRGVGAPHLLPESSFTPVNCRDMWSRVRRVSTSRDDISRIVSLIGHFRSSHYLRGAWTDNRALKFKAALERHGSFDHYGHRKFSYRIPNGFHYNVTNEISHRPFNVRDHMGTVRRVREYVNIDCHGSVRGGR